MRMYKKAIKQAGRASSMDSDMMEKKLTAAEKAGKSEKTTSLGGKTSVKGVKQENVGQKLGRGGGFAKGGLMKKK